MDGKGANEHGDGRPASRLTASARHRILNPEDGSALACARDYGFDLTLILRGVERTPQERLERAVQGQAMVRTIRALAEGLRRG